MNTEGKKFLQKWTDVAQGLYPKESGMTMNRSENNTLNEYKLDNTYRKYDPTGNGYMNDLPTRQDNDENKVLAKMRHGFYSKFYKNCSKKLIVQQPAWKQWEMPEKQQDTIFDKDPLILAINRIPHQNLIIKEEDRHKLNLEKQEQAALVKSHTGLSGVEIVSERQRQYELEEQKKKSGVTKQIKKEKPPKEKKLINYADFFKR